MHDLTSLPALQEYCAFRCDTSDDEHKRKISDVACKTAVRYAAARKPKCDSEKHRQRMRKRVGAAAQSELCGMGIMSWVVGEVLSWIVGKALDAWWEWYWSEPKSVELCGAMVQASALPAWSEDGGDND